MNGRILVVEDDRAIRDLVTTLFRDSGYDVVPMANGLEALHALRHQQPFDLVLLDMGLPLMSGHELAEQMHGLGIDVPILVMTAGRDARRAAHQVRAIGYIAKPFDIDELERLVRDALDGTTPPRPHLAAAPCQQGDQAAQSLQRRTPRLQLGRASAGLP